MGVILFSLSALGHFGCKQKQKPPPTVVTIAGESALLPRALAPASEPTVRATPHTVQVRGKRRDYLLIEPASPAPGPLPLILVLHGDGGGMLSFHSAWPFEKATQNGAYLAYLEGLNATWDLETLNGNRDIAFAEAAVEAIATALPIDKTRVFAAGYSSGGFFANVLACHRPGLLRAIASNAGGAPYNQAEKWGNGFPKCPGQKPVAVLALHGAQDSEVTLDSGRFDAEYWAYVNGCNDSEMETSGYPECKMYRGCPAGKNVGFCTIGPLGHWVWSESAIASWTFFQRQ
jgi:polyhydroxybutyrate depolymerase